MSTAQRLFLIFDARNQPQKIAGDGTLSPATDRRPATVFTNRDTASTAIQATAATRAGRVGRPRIFQIVPVVLAA